METSNLSQTRAMNLEFVNAIKEAPDGLLKNASSLSTSLIRREIKENGFTRIILPPKMVGPEDLTDDTTDTELPTIVEEMEPLSTKAKTISFDDTADTQTFVGDKFRTTFKQVTTDEYTKNIYNLMTYKNDLRQIITNRALKEIPEEEDRSFIQNLTAGLGAASPMSSLAAADATSVSGIVNNFEIITGLTAAGDPWFYRKEYIDILSILEKNRVPNGLILMNRFTAKSFLKWDRNEIGGDLSEKLFTSGLKGMPSSDILGVKHVFTIKDDIIPDGHVWLFTQPNFLGRFYVLDDVTMYVKKEEDIIRFKAKETIGMSLANVAGFARVVFKAA
jgi:hypothetical protein